MALTNDELREVRAISYHKTAMAMGSKAELAILKALYTHNPHIPLSNDDDAMLPVKLTLAIMENVYRTAPEITQMRGFEAFKALLEVLFAEDVSWLVLDTKGH